MPHTIENWRTEAEPTWLAAASADIGQRETTRRRWADGVPEVAR